MGYAMKYKKGKGFPFKSSPAKDVDLTKKTGLGPRTNEAMGKQFPQGEDKFREEQEDAAGVGTGSNRKVMKDGSTNTTHGAGDTGNWENPHAVKPKPSQDIYSDLEKYDDDN